MKRLAQGSWAGARRSAPRCSPRQEGSWSVGAFVASMPWDDRKLWPFWLLRRFCGPSRPAFSRWRANGRTGSAPLRSTCARPPAAPASAGPRQPASRAAPAGALRPCRPAPPLRRRPADGNIVPFDSPDVYTGLTCFRGGRAAARGTWRRRQRSRAAAAVARAGGQRGGACFKGIWLGYAIGGRACNFLRSGSSVTGW